MLNFWRGIYYWLFKRFSLTYSTIPPSATLFFDIELLGVKGSSPAFQPGRGVEGGQGRGQQGLDFSSNPRLDTKSSFGTGMTGLDIGQQSLPQPGTGFAGVPQLDSQFLSGISPPGQSQLSQSQSQDMKLASSLDMLTQNQGSSATSSQGQGMSAPSPGASTNMIDLATQGGGFMVGNQDFSSQFVDLSAQSQGLQSQSQSFGRLDSSLSGSGQQQLPSSGGQRVQGVGSSDQSWLTSSGQISAQSGASATGSQFQSSISGLGQTPGSQSSLGSSNPFQNVGSLGRDSPMRNIGFDQTPEGPPNPAAAGRSDILGPPGFPAGAINSPGSFGAMGRGPDRPQFGPSAPRFDSSRMFAAAQGPRPGMPVRMMNAEQPSFQMRPVGREGRQMADGQSRSFDLRPGMADARFGMGARGMAEMGRGVPGRGSIDPRRGLDGIRRTVGIGGIPDMGRRPDFRGMPDIARVMRSRGIPPMRETMDPRFRGMAPGAPMPGPPGFPGPGMAPRGIPPPMLLQRLRMLRRLRGFR